MASAEPVCILLCRNLRKRRISGRRSGWNLSVKGGSGKKSESGKESGGTARGKRSESGNGRGNESESGKGRETKTVTAGPGKGRQTEVVKGAPTAADQGRSAETEKRRETKRMKKRHMNAGNWRGNFETRKQPIRSG